MANFHFQKPNMGSQLVGLHMKKSSPTNLIGLLLSLDANPAKFHRDPSRFGQISMRFVEISTVALLGFDPKQIAANPNRNQLDLWFPWLRTGQLLCHLNLAGWFQVGHKPNLNRPVDSLNYNYINMPTPLCHHFSKIFSIK